MKKLISVTQKHIDASGGKANYCPIDRAVEEVVNKNVKVVTGGQFINFLSRVSNNHKRIELNERAKGFVRRHDINFKSVGPIKFYLDIPAKLLKKK